jgi:hypothetical protein
LELVREKGLKVSSEVLQRPHFNALLAIAIPCTE